MIYDIVVLALLTGACSVADHFSGGPYLGQIERAISWKLGRPEYYGAALIALVAALIHWPLAIFGLAFLIWRMPGWMIDGLGGLAPKIDAVDVGLLLVRHLLMTLCMVIAAPIVGLSWTVALWAGLFFALAAAALGCLNTETTALGHDDNTEVEFTRGAVLGACITIAVVAGR